MRTRTLFGPRVFRIVFFLGILFCAGCDPDEIKTMIRSSDLETAEGTGVAMIPVRLEYDIIGSDDDDLEKISNEIRSFLPSGSKLSVDMDDDAMSSRKLIVETFFPLGSETAIASVTPAPVCCFERKGDSVAFRKRPPLRRLNDRISDIDFSAGAGVKPEKFLFRLVCDTRTPMSVTAAAVFVDGEAQLAFQRTLPQGAEVLVEIRCGDDSVYSELDPVVFLTLNATQPSLPPRVDREPVEKTVVNHAPSGAVASVSFPEQPEEMPVRSFESPSVERPARAEGDSWSNLPGRRYITLREKRELIAFFMIPSNEEHDRRIANILAWRPEDEEERNLVRSIRILTDDQKERQLDELRKLGLSDRDLRQPISE